jgi:hypothetical protein
MAKKNQIAKRRKHFTQISNAFLHDNSLHLKDKGLFCILSSFSENWTFYDEHLLTLMLDRITSYKSALRALQKKDYVKIFQIRQQGRFANRLIILDDEGIADLPLNQLLELYNIRLKDNESIVEHKPAVDRKPVNGHDVNDSSVCDESAPNNTNTTNTNVSNTYLSESQDPILFRRKILQNYLGRPLCTPGQEIGFAPTTIISVSAIGYLHNEVSGRDLSPNDAKKVWEWAYEHQNLLFENKG